VFPSVSNVQMMMSLPVQVEYICIGVQSARSQVVISPYMQGNPEKSNEYNEKLFAAVQDYIKLSKRFH